ncbi:gamma-glutamyl hydrolase A-like [Culicoides brevitarsis]|uniref:gamma-glutamyl hydrolase A-like n=1 Tax=Culicoides brevitarsis TaxID=469753 RepID=UPI00307B7082
MTTTLNNGFPGHKQFIAASYVKFLEGGGARVVPVWINQTEDYYRDIMNKVNGIFFPGGSSSFKKSHGFSEAGYQIYKIAKELNDKGDYFPLWGTCLGFELLTYWDADRADHRVKCKSENQPLPLDFTLNYNNHRLFQLASHDIIHSLRYKNITSNFHSYCITEESLKKVGTEKNWITLSTNKDFDGLEFISSFEHSRYPFFGTQFHPEKNMYEWSIDKVIPHDEDATRANQYFARFFVEETRKNRHRFDTLNNELAHLIFNFPKTFTSHKSIYSECYLFKSEDDYPVEKFKNIKIEQGDENESDVSTDE